MMIVTPLFLSWTVYFTCHFVGAKNEFHDTKREKGEEEEGKLDYGNEQTTLR